MVPSNYQDLRRDEAFWTYCIRNLEEEVRRFWELEEPWKKEERPPNDKEVWQKSLESMLWNEDRYQVSLPWKDGILEPETKYGNGQETSDFFRKKIRF
mgnify:CR=1 FL=1